MDGHHAKLGRKHRLRRYGAWRRIRLHSCHHDGRPFAELVRIRRHSPDPDLDKKFCAEAADAGFVNLKGHRLVGGMRASIYNAMPAEGVDKLVDFMEKFRKENA